MSSPKRLELLDLICQGEKTVETLSRETGLTVPNTSQHLQTLKAARLIEAEKEGLYVKYRLADEMVCEFLRSMRVLAENCLAEVDMIKRRFLAGKEGMEPVNRDDLLKRVIEGGVTDDTQMLLFTAEGLILSKVRQAYAAEGLAIPAIYHAYLRWLYTHRQEQLVNDHGSCAVIDGILTGHSELYSQRAPGNSCFSSLRSGKMGTMDHPINDSKGCGGVMRVAPQ